MLATVQRTRRGLALRIQERTAIALAQGESQRVVQLGGAHAQLPGFLQLSLGGRVLMQHQMTPPQRIVTQRLPADAQPGQRRLDALHAGAGQGLLGHWLVQRQAVGIAQEQLHLFDVLADLLRQVRFLGGPQAGANANDQEGDQKCQRSHQHTDEELVLASALEQPIQRRLRIGEHRLSVAKAGQVLVKRAG